VLEAALVDVCTGQLQPGRLAYVRNYADTNIWRIEPSAPGVPASSLPAVAISSTRRDEVAQFSPDGRRVAFMSGRSGEWEVWVADASGANAVQPTFLAAVPGYPRWSPDGRTIAFHSNSEGHSTRDVFVVPADGGVEDVAAMDFDVIDGGVYYLARRRREEASVFRFRNAPIDDGR
jgi:dipeptidyl aminopeptidase/acylaminoacyl peptidase